MAKRNFVCLFDKAVVGMVSACVLISNSSSPFTNPLVTVPSTLITISCSIVFFSYLARSRYLFLILLSFNFTLWSTRMAKFTIQQVLRAFFFMITRSGHLAKFTISASSHFFFVAITIGLVIWQRLDPLVSQNLRVFCMSHFLEWILCCAYTISSYGQI